MCLKHEWMNCWVGSWKTIFCAAAAVASERKFILHVSYISTTDSEMRNFLPNIDFSLLRTRELFSRIPFKNNRIKIEIAGKFVTQNVAIAGVIIDIIHCELTCHDEWSDEQRRGEEGVEFIKLLFSQDYHNIINWIKLIPPSRLLTFDYNFSNFKYDNSTAYHLIMISTFWKSCWAIEAVLGGSKVYGVIGMAMATSKTTLISSSLFSGKSILRFQDSRLKNVEHEQRESSSERRERNEKSKR